MRTRKRAREQQLGGDGTTSITGPSPVCHHANDSISDGEIVKGVETEFDRTLPFWRCFDDLRHTHLHVRPAVVRRHTSLASRLPCTLFRGVDVVWATTDFTLCVPLVRLPGKPYRADSKESRLADYWQNVPHEEERLRIGTLHFVHRRAHRHGGDGDGDGGGIDRSFHIQSVVLQSNPAILQCVAGTMVTFSFIVYSSLRLVHARKHGNAPHARQGTQTATLEAHADLNELPDLDERKARLEGPIWTQYCPSPSSTVLILGMGGNSMALCLREVLGPDAEIHVVEVEPAVADVCRAVGTLRDHALGDGDTTAIDNHTHVHLTEAGAFLKSKAASALDAQCDFIYMDLFEPINATMLRSDALVRQCANKLKPGGELVVNDHQLPSHRSLEPFARLFGRANVQAVNQHGWNESVVVCVKPGDAATDGLSVSCTKSVADTVFNLYEECLPGWLPHYTWLRSSKVIAAKEGGIRVWLS